MVTEARRFNCPHTRLKRAKDACGDTILKLEQIIGRSLEPLCPGRTIGGHVNQFAIDPESCLLPLHGPIEDIADIEIAGDLTQVCSFGRDIVTSNCAR